MIPFSELMYPDVVQIRSKLLPQMTGKVAGNRDEHDDPGPRLACVVRIASDSPGFGYPGNAAQISGTVTFPSDPGSKRDDLIVHGQRTYRTTDKPRPKDSSGYSWFVPWIMVD